MADLQTSSLSRAKRWLILTLLSLVMAANYFFYDVLSPMQGILGEKLGFSNTDYGFLVSAYSIPNVFLLMAIIGGVVLDKLGVRITGFTFTFLMALGALLTTYGATDLFNQGGPGYAFFSSFLKGYSPALKMMSTGYLLFGLGAETSIVAITRIIIKCYKGKELAFALGLNLSFARVGTLAAFLFTDTLAKQGPWFKPLMLGALLLCISLLLFVFYIYLDLSAEKNKKGLGSEHDKEQFRITDIGKIIRVPAFIYITLLCVTFYSAVFPFLKYAPDMLQNKFGFDGVKSGQIVAILPFGTILLTPIFGILSDYKGRSATLMLVGSLLLIVAHLLFTFTVVNPYIPMFLLGVAFSLVPAVMWPSVAKIIGPNRLGTAYGLMVSVQNIGLWAFPIIIGAILDFTNKGISREMVTQGEAWYNYTYSMSILTVLGIFGIFFAWLLKRNDKTSGFGLETPNKAD